MAFSLLGYFGTAQLAASEGVTLGNQTINAGLGVTTVTVNVNIGAGTTVSGAWLNVDDIAVSIQDQSGILGYFEEARSVPITLAIVAEEDHQGRTFLGQVNVSHSGGTATGFLTIHVAAATVTPTPTPTPQAPTIRMTAPTTYVEMTPGVPSIVNVTLENTGRHMARDFRILPTSNANFTVETVGNLQPFNLNQNTQRTFQLRITPHTWVENITESIQFSYTFENNVRDVITQTGTIWARVYTPTAEEPRVVLTGVSVSPTTVNAGEDFTITATLRNTSAVRASNVQISAGGFAEGGLISRGETSSFVGSMNAGTNSDVTFAFSTNANIATGSRPIVFTLRFDNADGEVVTVPITSYVTIIGDGADIETDRARLVVTSISQPSGTFTPGQEATVNVTVQNNGERDATNVRVSANPEEGVVPRLASIQTAATLAVGESETFSFAFTPTGSARSQFYNIGFTVAYDIGHTEEGSPVRDSFEQFTGFNVYNPDADDDDDDEIRSVPRIIISDYTIEPLIVMANTEFDLSLTVMNTHSERAIGNIMVTWEVTAITVGNEITGGNVFTPVDSSNTFFINHIPPRGTYEHQMRLFAIPDAAPRNHTITINFVYEDMDGNPFDTEANIGVNVRQQSRLELSLMPGIPTTVMQGDRVDTSITALNAGRSTLFNLRVRLEGEGISPTEEVFGNVTSGNMHNFWANFFAMEPGPTTVYLIATFEDEMGDAHEVIQSFDMDVWGMDGGFDDGDFGMGGDFGGRFPEGGGDFGMWDDDGMGEGGFLSGLLMPIASGGGVLLLAGGTIVIVVLVKRKRRQNDDFGFDNDRLS